MQTTHTPLTLQSPTLSTWARAWRGIFCAWYAAYTRANHEKRVAEQLERRSTECFLPLYESVRRWKDRRVRLHLPLFPGYVFVRLALRDRLRVQNSRRRAACRFRWPPGAASGRGYRSDSHVPCPTPFATASVHTARPAGAAVQWSAGRLDRNRGTAENCTRFVISLELLMRSVAVEIDTSDFDLLASPRR